ncbi:MAG: hypothetical protein A2170_09720 [Deltaproteobacteria bacterium RBG_13_53_10]|nr:MAG: hypothetical protein A2170_09720 [Deltaproteobacteria bacterium RBG_13_53_10]
MRERMIRIEGKTKLSESEVIDRIRRFFGKGGLGLELGEEDDRCLHFEGGGGYVTATVCLEEGGSRVELVTQEWEVQAKRFVSELPRK